MTNTTDKLTPAGAVELSEDSLDQASAGAAYIKFDGIDGDSLAKMTKISTPQIVVKGFNKF